MIEIIDLYTNHSTEARTQLVKTLKFSNYKSISKLWVDAILSAPTGVLSLGWSLDKILVNGKGASFSGTQVSIKMFDKDIKGGNQIRVTPGENNIISVAWFAPLGAGVISPHANITIKVRVEGEKKIPGIDSETLENLNPSNIRESLDLFADKATLPTIGIIIIFLIIFIALLFFLPRILLTKKLVDEV